MSKTILDRLLDSKHEWMEHHLETPRTVSMRLTTFKELFEFAKSLGPLYPSSDFVDQAMGMRIILDNQVEQEFVINAGLRVVVGEES